MSTIKSLSLVLVLGLSSFVTACTSSDAAPAPQSPTTVAQPSSSSDANALCIEVMTRNRTCTDAYIPALVDARARVDRPAGIADAVKADRDGVIAQAKEEWKADSTDEAIVGMCNKLAQSKAFEPGDVDASRACLAKSDCGEYTACIMPIGEKSLAK